MNIDNGIPSFIIIPAVESNSSSCSCDKEGASLPTLSPPRPPADSLSPPPSFAGWSHPKRERWSSEGSNSCKCSAPPSRPQRSSMTAVAQRKNKIDIDARLKLRLSKSASSMQYKSGSSMQSKSKQLGRWGDSQENLNYQW